MPACRLAAYNRHCSGRYFGFAGGGARNGRFLAVDTVIVVAGMGGSIRRVVEFGVVSAGTAAAAAGEGSNPAALVLAASNSLVGTPSAEENLHCYSTAPAAQETRHGNTAAVADPEV